MFKRIAALKILVVALLVLLAVASGATLYWVLYVRGRAAYLTDRNLRALETLSGYIERSLDSDVSTLDSYMKLPPERRKPEAARRLIPLVGLLEGSDRYAASPPDVTVDLARFYLSEPLSGIDWSIARRRPMAGSKLEFRVRLERVLAPVLSDQLANDVFDDVVVATTDGQVLFQRQPAHLRIQSLAALQIEASDPRSVTEFSKLASTTSVVSATMAGNRYQVFIQPCCASIRAMDKSNTSRGWVIVGLTPAARTSARSLALSFTLLAPLIILIAAAFLSWPFLKFGLVGKLDTVRLIDAAAVAASAVVAVALLTVVLLDFHAVRGMGHRLDNQLEVLSSQLQANFLKEITAAEKQLKALEQRAATRPELAAALTHQASEPVDVKPFIHVLKDESDVPYPLFEVFAVAHTGGYQAVKWTSSAFLTPLVAVAEREYFSHWKRHERSGDDEFFLQSLRSVTTGRKQAVLSAPAADGLVKAARKTSPDAPGLLVSTLTMPMASLMDSIVASGFGYAVIDAKGAVLFHSDPSHSLEEQLFLETDRNRPLRAAVAARRESFVDLPYFGGEYRARVSPLEAPNISADDSKFLSWTLLAFYDKSVFRGLHLEWLFTAMVFLIAPLSLYLLAAGVVHVIRPHYVAPWIWPDRRNHRSYVWLCVAAAMWVMAAGMAIICTSEATALVVVTVIPIFGWILCFARLSAADRRGAKHRIPAYALSAIVFAILALTLRAETGLWTAAVAAPLLIGAIVAMLDSRGSERPRDPATGWPTMWQPFCGLAFLMLTLTAILPAVAAFRMAETIQVDAFVKSRQLGLARDLEAQKDRTLKSARDAEVANPSDFERFAAVGDYTSAFLATERLSAAGDRCTGAAPRGLVSAIAGLLPYFSESSVELRGLVHDGTSGDRVWDWHRPRAGRLVLHLPGRSEQRSLRLASDNTLLTEWPEPVQPERWLLLTLVCVAPLLLTFVVVDFISRHVFLVDLATSESADEPVAAVVPSSLGRGAPGDDLELAPRGVTQGPVIPRTERIKELEKEWKTLSNERKVTLDQVFVQGVVNEHARGDLTELLERGFLRRAPHFVVADELRELLGGAECREQITALEKKESAWGGIRVPLFCVLSFVTLFFVFTQQQMLSEAVKIIAGILTMLPGLVSIAKTALNKTSAAKSAA